jgi:hypothetical protein
LTLFYRGSIHGWWKGDFHNNCDYSGPTISLFQIRDGNCIGGFTNTSWTSGGSEWKEDKGAILFNLTTHASFPCKNPSYAIKWDTYEGPNFGDGELRAGEYSFYNTENACSSLTFGIGGVNPYNSYKIPLNSEGINLLTNKKCDERLYMLCYFTVSELEVWGVSFNK